MSIDFYPNQKVHIVGVNGIGTSSLARYLVSCGVSVSGSDNKEDSQLTADGIAFYKQPHPSVITSDLSLVVYSNAVDKNHPEIVKANSLAIKVISYPEALGSIVSQHYTIAVSGTHGKSTTTAMIATILEDAQMDPTVIIGTKLKRFNDRNFRKGSSQYLIIEADEYKAALLNYHPQIATINNIEEDHLDFYKDLDDIVSTFQKYISENVRECVVINGDDANVARLDIPQHLAKDCFSLESPLSDTVKLKQPGEHNLYNALCAIAVARRLGIKDDVSLRSLANFEGSWRRFEEREISIGKKKINLINDYAHHPTAVSATIKAAREKYPQHHIVAVFQPHQYERSYRLFEDFRKCFKEATCDKLIVTDIYTVEGRESEEIKRKVNAEKMISDINNGMYLPFDDSLQSFLKEYLQDNSVLIIMGAGDVYLLDKILED